MIYCNWYLQYLADGSAGDGGDAGTDGTATGENAVGAADLSSRLAEMGVPQDKIERRKKQLDAKSAKATQTANTEEAPAAEDNPQQEEAPQAEAGDNVTPAKRLSWDEIMKDPEYNKAMQDTVNKRLKSAKASQDTVAKLVPALEVLASYYNMDASDLSKLDVDELVRKVVDDNTYYEDRAVASGQSVEEVKREVAKARADKDLIEENRRQKFFAAHQQGERLKQTVPTFDLLTELKNPKFEEMVIDHGVSVEDAYFAFHRAEIMQAIKDAAVKQATVNASRAIQAGAKRPAENGATPQAASVSTINYKDPQYRAALRQQIYAAAARGEKIYPQR